ncbi:hypothetical protein FB548_3565 [Pseudoxanthomonas sp. 3HH-4]|uniref:hypothetical protein n=1 Tax=Pseudoxanthomonas sp. 3HH-4 TaxID=1690214 RepID=UPI0011741E26|nr:hypothetical protein [Pseudoxanthomonas sp. 3HH-4]TQM03606.1 hypothetical protein FB548_3565 [Pseudoxanthomonas sp. 3HH-4]
MRAWLRRETQGMWGSHTYASPFLEKQRNPYAGSLETLGASIAQIVDDAFNFIEAADEIHPIEGEIRRIRLETELVLHTARFCEAAIKQMLHCTSFSRAKYKNAALGELLAQDCHACRKAGAPNHQFSLMGSLAHQYYQCLDFEQCGFDHLVLTNKRRNVEAAHSDAQRLRDCTVRESRQALKTTLDEVANAFTHLLGHIAGVETALIREIEIRIEHYPNMPPREAFRGLLTKTSLNYDEKDVYQGPGYLERQIHERRARRAKQSGLPTDAQTSTPPSDQSPAVQD